MTDPVALALVSMTTSAYQRARLARDEAIAAAMADGHRQADVAEAAGLSPSAVRKIAGQVAEREQ